MLVGREDLLTEVRAALATSGRAVLTGPRGAGRTAILGALTEQLTATGRPVVRMSPARGIAHLGLADLLEQIALDGVAGLPARQAAAVEAVLCRGEQRPADPLALRLGALALVRQLATAPVLVVDDVQWLDPLSVDVIGFVADRAELALLTARPATAGPTAGLDRDAVEFAIPRLTVAQVVELLGSRGLAYRAAVQVHAASGGHPRLALALGAGPHRTGRARGGAAVLSRAVEQAAQDLLDGTAPGVRRLVMLTALAGRLPTPMLPRSAVSARDVVVAELAGLVQVDPDDHLRLCAEVLAEVVTADAGPDELAEGHHTLAAAAIDEPTRLWHLAMTATAPDAALARALAGARATMRARGRRAPVADDGPPLEEPPY
ncbi:ATP-binding protein, partial [Catellatospora methionotrophica]|uniref:ATP-binding protein n=1 Tax=Catellatospora methionotrophica TaxID=121620 RepID=UPI0033E516F4